MSLLLFEVWEGLMAALRAIAAHKLRAVLTTLGIIIGIVAVTLMATVINGIERDFNESLSELGTDVLYVEKWPWIVGPGSRWWEYINRPDITPELADVIEERARYVVAAVPVLDRMGTARYGGTTVSSLTIVGAEADYPRVHAVDLALGRFYTEVEERSARAVCVLGAEVASRLFPVEQPLGKFIRLSGHRCQVIGVLQRKGSGPDSPASTDTQVFIPFRTYARFFGIRNRSVSIHVKVVDPELMALAKDELTGVLRVARRLDALEKNNFEINEQQALREQLAPVKTAIYGVGLFLTGLSLLVGGVGVMNIMFVSVKERTREIGIRKAVGATRRAILVQFLIEAILVCLIGGVIGVLLAMALTGVVNLFIDAFLPATTVAIAFLICVLTGITFGLAPAWTAARAQPIEALRYE
ncbi:ABC transporter permease [Rhodothermus marinus]|uniref:ABC transporter permease n=1 Tax=Rhodothermus marinus TaxID=29549 RepID=UPI001DC967EE|nr:ABC transporter permease [Rhodothermus marinus]MBO2491757.1 FtsX-like permease family protein [Rhodothermus marinus]